MGLCLSYNATITAVKRMGINHDKKVLDWTREVSCLSEVDTDDTGCDESIDSGNDEAESDNEVVPNAGEECDLPTDRAVVIIGDNWDKNIKPRDMRMNNQVKSLHLFHSVATVSRIETLHLDDKQSIGNVNDIPISCFLPSIEDCKAICDNYVVLAARVITENFEHFFQYRDCVPKHIHHEYLAKMSEKTTMVRDMVAKSMTSDFHAGHIIIIHLHTGANLRE